MRFLISTFKFENQLYECFKLHLKIPLFLKRENMQEALNFFLKI